MEHVGLVVSQVGGGVVVLVLGVAGGLISVRPKRGVLEVCNRDGNTVSHSTASLTVLVRVGPGGPPADDGGGHREPPPYTDQTHTEPHGWRTEEMIKLSLAQVEESGDEEC